MEGRNHKKYAVPLEWARGILFLQGVTGLGLHKVDLMRMDIFNVLTYLRLNKAKTNPSYEWTNEKESNNIVFSLNPKAPVLTLEPWGRNFWHLMKTFLRETKSTIWKFFGNRRDLLLLDRLTYTTDAHFTLFDSAMHTSLELEGEGFAVS